MIFNATKVVANLPGILEPDTLYLVRVGDGFDFYCSDATGAIAHKLNQTIADVVGLQSALNLKLNITDVITETIKVHLSDNVTPVGQATNVESLTLRYNFAITTGVWFQTAFQAPSGSAAIVRVLADTGSGFTNIFTSVDALTIPAASTSVGPLVPNTTFLPAGTVLRFDIQQVGAINTGRGYRVTLQGTRS